MTRVKKEKVILMLSEVRPKVCGNIENSGPKILVDLLNFLLGPPNQRFECRVVFLNKV